MELTIEIVGRGGRHFDLQNVSGNHITIGRGFDNDIVLSDPHICAHHAVLEKDINGEPVLRDLNSINGTYTKDHQLIASPQPVLSGDEFILGKTRLRVYQRQHALPPSIRLTWIENLAQYFGSPLLSAVVIFISLVMSMLFKYNETVKEFYVGRELVTAIGMLLVISIWPACWSVYARIRKHEARFIAQLSVTLVAIIVTTFFQKLHNWLAFHLGGSFALQLIMSSVSVAVTLLLIWFNYYLSIFQSTRRRWIYSVIFTALLSSFAYVATTFDAGRFKSKPDYNASLYPPSLTVYSAQTVDAYLENAESIFGDAGALANKD